MIDRPIYRLCSHCRLHWEIGKRYVSFKYLWGIPGTIWCPECEKKSLAITKDEFIEIDDAVRAAEHSGSTDLHHVLDRILDSFHPAD
jgi:hypothetical protein